MKFESVFKSLDHLLIKKLEITPDREKEFYSIRERTKDTKDILYDMDIIDSKSSALLTHISIMFVVLGFFLNEQNSFIVQAALLIEFVSYLIVGMLLLRCIDVMGPPFRIPPNDDAELKATYYIEVTLRREIYHRALRTVYILTAALIPIVFVKFIF